MDYQKLLKLITLLTLLLLPALAHSQDNLLIITPDEFMDELQPLKRFKDASGRPTIILPLSQIYNDPKYNSFRDGPEKIKNCISDYESTHNIHYVMLVGDIDKFPVRSCKAYNTKWGSMYYPSDLYYADLYKADSSFDDWDGGNAPYGGNKIYGEMDFEGFKPCDVSKLNLDLIDLYPDVSVGRVPASDAPEVTTYVNKVITYELKTLGSWFNKAVWVIDNDFCDPPHKEELEGYLTPHGFTISHLYYDDYDQLTDPQRAAEINNALNGGVGFLNHCGHAGMNGWDHWYDTAYMINLNNSEKLSVVYSTGCSTARFFWQGCGCAGCVPEDFYQDINGNEWKRGDCGVPITTRPEPMAVQPSTYDKESFAEKFLVKRDDGGIAYIGDTFESQYGGFALDKYFFEGYDVNLKPPALGEMWRYSLEQFIANKNPCDYHAYVHLHKVMLFGDPSLRVGGAYTTSLQGNVYDANGGPLESYSRYRVVNDVTVPAMETLTVEQSASILFEDQNRIIALGSDAERGFIVNGTSSDPACFLSLASEPQAQQMVHGVKVYGELKMRNGGEMKLY